MKWFVALLSAFFINVPLEAFTSYVANGHYLRWDLQNPGLYSPNLVNPATRAIRFYIASDAYSGVNREAELNAVRACFDQWQSVPGTAVRFEFAGLSTPGLELKQDGTNVIFWYKGGESAAKALVQNRKAYTQVQIDPVSNRILEADIVLNGVQYPWFTDFNDTVSQAQFIESVLLHEIGHFLGLDHTPVGGGTVINGANGIDTEVGLSPDEMAAARFLYQSSLAGSGRIHGVVTLSGAPILGAMVTIEDSAGNVVQGTVTKADGSYEFPALSPGDYKIRVSPLDPKDANPALMKGADIQPLDYANAVTAFGATENLSVSVAAGQDLAQNFAVTPGNPAFRIAYISRPTTIPDLVGLERAASKIERGTSNMYVGVSGANIPADAVLTVTGDGITMGQTVFKPNRFPGLNTLTAGISVTANATPGLRSFVVRSGNKLAYANGYLEVTPAFPDYNFDALDDRFQRKYFPLWTSPDSAPSADPDHDGFGNAFEFRTGTSPIDAKSFRLWIASIRVTPGTATLVWPSESGKRYQVHSRSSLSLGGTWNLVGGPVTAASDNASFSERRGNGPGIKVYRLELLP
jgi:hypothetical protein